MVHGNVAKAFCRSLRSFLLLTWPKDTNCIKGDEVDLHGHKKNAICEFMSVEKLKKIAKKHNNATLNDVVLAMASVALKKYFEKHGSPDNQSANLFIPFSFRPLPRTAKDLVIENDFSALTFTLDLRRDFKESISLVQKKTKALKKSMFPFGIRMVQDVASLLPGMIG